MIDSESNSNNNSTPNTSVAITDSISNVGNLTEPQVNINWDISTEDTSPSSVCLLISLLIYVLGYY